MKRPLLSICVTVYNLKDYVGQCLDSVLNQKFDDYELLVADNGSTDGSVEICEEYAAKYPDKMTFFKFPPPTILGRSYNKVMQEARGLYIHNLDGDDCLAPDYFENVANIISTKHPELIMGCFTGISSVDGLAPFHDVSFEANKINGVKRNIAIKYILSLPTLRFSIWRFTIKRNLLKFDGKNERKAVGKGKLKARSYDPRMANNEGLYMIALMLRAKSIVFLDKPTYFYRRRHGSLSGTIDSKTAIRLFSVVWGCHRYIKKHHLKITRKGLQGALVLYMKRYLNGLFMPFYDDISPDDLAYLSHMVDDDKNLIAALKKYHDPDLGKLSELLLEHGSADGIKRYGQYKTGKFLEVLNHCRKKQILIFPTGMFGEATARQLFENHFDIIGFLDNDEKRSGITVDGLPCNLPECLRELSLDEKENTVVVIASIYESVAEKLKKQTLELGINAKNIFVRD